MAEKRKLPARERREPAAKRRVSEAISGSSSRRKKSTPALSTPAAESTPERQATPEPIEEPLPTKIKDADPLPTRIRAQPSLTLSDKEYQSFAERYYFPIHFYYILSNASPHSAILSISLDRSKKKWLSDGIFERYWTKPKKTKREQLEGKNPPKDSMTKIGPCKIIIEPHHFDGMIYTVKDPNAKPTVQITAPQRHIIHYGPPPPQAGYQYQHYAPPQQMRPPSYPYNQHPNSQHAPPRPPQPPQPVPRQPPAQAQIQGPPPQPAKPSPDPVIQMLATRAASDPELKALMRIVASSKATQEQLRIFQGHIDELNAIIRQRERQQQQYYQQNPQAPRPQSTQPQNSPQTAPPTPQQSQTMSTPSTPVPTSLSTPQSSSTPVPATSAVKPEAPSQSGAQASPQENSTKQESQPQAAPGTTQSSNANINTSTPNDTIQIKKEPGTSTSVAATPTPASAAPPPPTPPAAAAASTNAASNVAAPVSTPNAPSPAPYNAPNVSAAPGYASANPSPQPLSPYPPGPSQHSPYHTPYYPTGPPIKARGAPNYGPSNTYYQSVPAPPAPKPPIKAVVFEFTSPLTPYGSSTSGHAGSGDRYLFPEHTILEYQAGGTVLLASFLLVRKVDPNTKFPLELAADIAPKTKGKASKSKKKDKIKAADQSGASTPAPDIEANAAGASTDEKKQPDTGGNNEETSATTEQPQKEEPSNLKEYYQPITMRFYSSKPATLEPLSRIVKPAAEVRKYMEEVMERAERAPAGYLPFRLPREKPLDIADDADKGDAAPATLVVEDSKTRSRGESIAAVATPRDADDGGDTEDPEQEDLEFLLKDHYDPPSGLVPIRA